MEIYGYNCFFSDLLKSACKANSGNKIDFCKLFKEKISKISAEELNNYLSSIELCEGYPSCQEIRRAGRLAIDTHGIITFSDFFDIYVLMSRIDRLEKELKEEKEKYSKLKRKTSLDKENQLQKNAISKITHKYIEQDFKYFEKDDCGRLICPSGDYSEIYYFSDYESYVFGDYCIFKETGIHVEGRSIFGDNCIFGSSNRFAAGSTFGKDCVFGGYSTFRENTSFGNNCHFGEKCNFALYSDECLLCSYRSKCNRKICLNGKRISCNFGTSCSFGIDCNFAEGCYFGTGCSFAK